MSTAQPAGLLKSYAAFKARQDPPEKMPSEVGTPSGKGVLLLIHGRYWRDVSKIWIEFDKGYLGYDYYRHGKAPAQGNLTLDAELLRRLVTLGNALWASPKDNEEVPDGHPPLVGIEKMTQVLLKDNGTYRIIPFSTRPLKPAQDLQEEVWKLLGPRFKD